MNSHDIEKSLMALGNSDIALQSQGYFKNGKGQYGEGDVFLGIRMPVLRQKVKDLRYVAFNDSKALLLSKYHEVRIFSLLHMVHCFTKANEHLRSEIYHYYLANTKYINNWDLVDSSAHLIVGPYLENHERSILSTLAQSTLLWDRRIAMMACFHFIRKNEFTDALHIARLLLKDKHDLIHKAVGWMLREVGNRDKNCEVDFLDQHYPKMPRTMLRYAIEKLTKEQRQAYLKG